MTHNELLDWLRYDRNTGEFRWNTKPARRILIGSIAGTEGSHNGWWYRTITIERRKYLAHRLAWLYVTRHWPDPGIDHRDGDGLNNRWDNLREGTPAQNAQNTRLSSANTTGYRGVSIFRRGWRAEICAGGIRRHLGTFETAEQAASAYLAAKTQLHPFQPVPR